MVSRSRPSDLFYVAESTCSKSHRRRVTLTLDASTINAEQMVGEVGLEPTTFRIQTEHSKPTELLSVKLFADGRQMSLSPTSNSKVVFQMPLLTLQTEISLSHLQFHGSPTEGFHPDPAPHIRARLLISGGPTYIQPTCQRSLLNYSFNIDIITKGISLGH